MNKAISIILRLRASGNKCPNRKLFCIRMDVVLMQGEGVDRFNWLRVKADLVLFPGKLIPKKII